jgi:hypothetical protein
VPTQLPVFQLDFMPLLTSNLSISSADTNQVSELPSAPPHTTSVSLEKSKMVPTNRPLRRTRVPAERSLSCWAAR